jgi:hypothetical protein
MRLAAPIPKTGVVCSACGAMVVIRPSLRWTKMQCPKCRAVTALPNSNAAEPIPEKPQAEVAGSPAPERPEAARFEARLSTLEARLVSLEQELEIARNRKAETGLGALSHNHESALETAEVLGHALDAKGVAGESGRERSEIQPRHHGSSASLQQAIEMAQADEAACDPEEQESPPAKASESLSEIAMPMPQNAEAAETATAPSTTNTSTEPEPVLTLDDEGFKAAAEDRMVEKLEGNAAGQVAIRVKAGDTEAILFGEWLGLVFIRAGWTVTAFEARPLPPEEQDLTLAISGNFPFPKKASTIHSALAEAGLGLVFGFDSTSDSPIPTLIVPRRPAAKSDQSRVDAQQSSPNIKSGGFAQ